MDAFGPSFAGADHLVLTDIYAAGEDPIPGATLETLSARVRESIAVPVDVVPNLADVPSALARVARPGDVVITLGAGSIASVPVQLVTLLERRSGARTGAQA
jgi:UDP-N-acetylmuramate--alanine ligase